jgi:hypothetical protein
MIAFDAHRRAVGPGLQRKPRHGIARRFHGATGELRDTMIYSLVREDAAAQALH